MHLPIHALLERTAKKRATPLGLRTWAGCVWQMASGNGLSGRFFESIWIERDAIFFSLRHDRNDNQYSNKLNIVQSGVILRVC